jgi:hypothetical protein
MPVLAPTVAIDVALLVQVPPDTEFVSVIGVPMHKLDAPDIEAGVVVTVTVLVTVHVPTT